MLGDGTMRIGHDSINANFKVEHGLEQKDLVFWKYKILKPWVFTEPKLSYRYDENRKKYPKSWWFRTVRHPILTRIQKQFYPNKVKVVPSNLGRTLDRLALACWVMDDGSFSHNIIDISTYSFTLAEIRELLKILSKKFSIKGSYYKDRDKGFRLYFRVSETRKLVKLIKPFVISSMRYKIGYSNWPRKDFSQNSERCSNVQSCIKRRIANKR